MNPLYLIIIIPILAFIGIVILAMCIVAKQADEWKGS